MRNVQKRNGVIGLPIVDINSALQGLKDSRTMELVFGVRRQVIVMATQMLEAAKRNQMDGQVELDKKDLGLLLQALALTVECMRDLFHDLSNEDDEQI